MKVTNNGTAPRGIRVDGIIKVLRPGESRDLALKGVELERAQGITALEIEAVVVSEADEKADLIARLKALGIDAAGNSKPETLRKKLDEAEAAKVAADAEAALKLEVISELKGLNVEVDEAASLADLQAALVAAKA